MSFLLCSLPKFSLEVHLIEKYILPVPADVALCLVHKCCAFPSHVLILTDKIMVPSYMWPSQMSVD